MTLTVARRAAVQQQVQVGQLPQHPLPPPVTGEELWVDCSNYTGPLTDHGCADLKAAGYVGIIAQAITGLDGKTYTRQQLAAALRNGLRIAGYIWCFPVASVSSRLLMFDGFPLEFLALDVEQAGLSIANVDRDLALCDEYMVAQGMVPTGLSKDSFRLLHPTIIYTARWFFAQQGWLGLTRWSERPLWEALYDGIPDVSVGFWPYGGWTKMTIKQWRGTSNVGEVQQVDLNVTAAA